VYPQLINALPTVLLALNTIGLLGVYFYFKNKYLQDFPGRRTITELQVEVGELTGMIADLTDRFNRFQKKENMRQVRADRTAEQDVLTQAKEIAAQNSSQEPDDGKLSLYKRSH
jgi:TolA-binding protein